jgi:hypothetical protein
MGKIRDEINNRTWYKRELAGIKKDKEWTDAILKNDLWEPEFFDMVKILQMGATKHGNKNWLDVDGKKSSHKDMHDSMFHHLAKSFSDDRYDDESGEDHLLHLALRALMMYTRRQRGLIHPNDIIPAK